MTDNKENIVLRLNALTTGYRTKKGEKILAREINADLEAGCLTCLLGPNGSGKSTLLRTLCRFQPPLKGKIEILNKDLNAYSQSELSRTLGVVLTEKLMVSNMTARRLVEIGRSPYTGFWGRLSKKDEEIVERAIELAGITPLADRNIQTLSDGERQKALIAKVIAQQTPVIFLDEPTAFLDYPSKVELMQLLGKLARNENKTVFLSTHDLELALHIADNIWLLDRKLGLKTGTTDQMIHSGEIGRYFNREGITFDRNTGTFLIDKIQDIEL